MQHDDSETRQVSATKGCCGAGCESGGQVCGSRFTCSPCLVLWGVAICAFVISYLAQ
jgi:hypothetical protein